MMALFSKLSIVAAVCFFFQGLTSTITVDPENKNIATGIYLDTLQNELMLAYENGMPAYYYSEIFTPVCETGECKPIYINIYWNLMGEYTHFDQPKGEILTKLDHEPFTKDDYQLLHEILQDEDPRFGLVKHAMSSPDLSSGKKESSDAPAPAAAPVRMILKKSQMVDAITGSTLPEQEDKFVPGALYTTYTVWDLANTHQAKMEGYTRKNLFKPKYYQHLIYYSKLGCRAPLAESLGKGEENGYPNALMTILDSTSSNSLAAFCAGMVYYYDVELDTVQNTFERVFFEKGVNYATQKQVLFKWDDMNIKPHIATRLARSLNVFHNLFSDILYTIQVQEKWPDGMVAILIDQIELQKEKEHKRNIYDMLAARKDRFSSADLKLFNTVKRKF